MTTNENQLYALAIAVAKGLAASFELPELAVLAAFLQTVVVNISLHIQTSALHNIRCQELNAAGPQDVRNEELLLGGTADLEPR